MRGLNSKYEIRINSNVQNSNDETKAGARRSFVVRILVIRHWFEFRISGFEFSTAI